MRKTETKRANFSSSTDRERICMKIEADKIQDRTSSRPPDGSLLLLHHLNCKGQAMVEFTLAFVLLLLVTWIPAEFGLAFYTTQIAQNAVREGARIAAADPNLVSGTNTSCGPPLSSCFSFGNIFNETAVRLPAALMHDIRITVIVDPASDTNCNEMVTVQAQGTFRFFFYQILRLMGIGVSDERQITTLARMRWEHQANCTP